MNNYKKILTTYESGYKIAKVSVKVRKVKIVSNS